LGGLKQND